MNKRIIRITSLALCLCLALSSCSNKEKQKVEDAAEKSQTEVITNRDGEKRWLFHKNLRHNKPTF